MGKDVDIYGLNYRKIKTLLFEELQKPENRELLDLYVEGSAYEPSDIHVRLSMEPQNLSMKEWWWIIWAYQDAWELGSLSMNHNERSRKMAECGLSEVFSIGATNPACVFMECFHDMFCDDKLLLAQDDDWYKISCSSMKEFVRRMIVLTTTFYEDDNDKELYYEDDSEHAAANKDYAVQTLNEQIKYRERNPEDMKQKWGADYFSFSRYCSDFMSLLNEVENYDEFLIVDR